MLSTLIILSYCNKNNTSIIAMMFINTDLNALKSCYFNIYNVYSIYCECAGGGGCSVYLCVLQLEWVSHLAQDWRSEAAAESCRCSVKRFCS